MVNYIGLLEQFKCPSSFKAMWYRYTVLYKLKFSLFVKCPLLKTCFRHSDCLWMIICISSGLISCACTVMLSHTQHKQATVFPIKNVRKIINFFWIFSLHVCLRYYLHYKNAKKKNIFDLDIAKSDLCYCMLISTKRAGMFFPPSSAHQQSKSTPMILSFNGHFRVPNDCIFVLSHINCDWLGLLWVLCTMYALWTNVRKVLFVCLSVCTIQLENRSMDFDEIWYALYASTGYTQLVLFNFL
jgi:hypothetical protein